MANGKAGINTSVQRRRRWSAAEKQQLVTSSLAPGASVPTVAREAGIRPNQLYRWRREVRDRKQVSFAPVRITPGAAPADLSAPGMIAIEFVNGSRMRIAGANDPATLTAVVLALTDGRQA